MGNSGPSHLSSSLNRVSYFSLFFFFFSHFQTTPVVTHIGTIPPRAMSDFYNQHPLGNKQPGFASEIGDSTWQVNNNNRLQLVLDDDDDDGTSLRSCMFPCQENERPSQGLSLSLSSSNTRTIGLQSFERIPHAADTHDPNSQEETRFMDPCFIRDVGLSDHDHPSSVHQQIILQGYQFDLRRCKHLVPAQELLNEFCGLETKLNEVPRRTQKQKQHCDDADGSSASRLQSLSSLDFLDLQKRKRKLVSMLEELERRYMHYCNQMNAVVSSFESAAGVGAAAAYSSLASKAMSKHFRYLKDCIVTQIHATKKAMGEKDQVAPGTSRSETPTPRVIDQALRKQRAFQQISMMGIHPWRPQRGLSERSAFVLRAWLFEHFLHPYPSDADKHILARQTGLSRSQVSNWFINARVRLWKPLVEQMYMEESKDGVNEHDDDDDHETDGRLNILTLPSADQKPTPDQDKNDSISNRGPSPNKGSSFHGHHEHTAGFRAFGAVELDFSSYNHPAGGVSFAHHNERTGGGAHGHNVNFNGGVSSMFLGPSDFRTVVQQLTGLQKNTKVSSDDDQLLTENKCGSIYQVTTVPKEQIPRRHNKKLPPPGTMENRALSRSSLLVFEDPLRLEQERSQNRSDNRRHPRSLAVGTQQKQSNDLHADAPLSSLQATRFRAEYFVELKFAGCTLYEQAWLGRQRIGSLRVIDFSNSNLKNLPDLSEAHQLTSLILRGCKNLANVACIQYLAKLEHLNLKGCTKLTGLPSMMHLKLLSSIDLSHCRNLKRLPVSIGSLSSLTSLNLKNCKRLEVLPVSNLRVKSIQSFDISGCSNLIKRASAAMRTLEFYMHMTVEAMHLADVFGDIRDLVEARFHQTSNLQKREDLRDITCFLEEIKESIPRTVASMRSALTCRTSLEERLAHVSASFLEAQGECFALDAKLTMLSDEESKLDAEIEALIARKEEPLELSN